MRTFGLYFLTSFIGFVITFAICSFSNITIDEVDVISNSSSRSGSFVETFVPDNFFQMLSSGNILQLIFVCLLLGYLSFSLSSKNNDTFRNIVSLGQDFCLKAITLILKVAPCGVFSLVASTISKLDYDSIPQIAKLCVLLVLSLSIHALIILPLLAKIFGKFSGYKFLNKMRQPLILALTTASSNAALPVSLKTLKQEGKVPDEVADFVLPMGATFNMDGSAMFQTLIYLCVAAAAQINISGSDYIVLVLIVVFSSVGVAGIPGGALAVTAYMFNYLGLPEQYLGVVILLDRFFDYPITMVNVWGDLVVAKIIGTKT